MQRILLLFTYSNLLGLMILFKAGGLKDKSDVLLVIFFISTKGLFSLGCCVKVAMLALLWLIIFLFGVRGDVLLREVVGLPRESGEF